MRLIEEDTRDYRSVSQHKQYQECGWRYYLSRVARDERGERLWQRPAAWLVQGTAVHAACEALEKSGRTLTLEETLDVFRAAFESETSEYTQQTPDFKDWAKSGPYAGAADLERRFTIGQVQTHRYWDHVASGGASPPWVTPAGELAVELEFDVKFGDVPVRGYIDLVEDRGAHRGPIDWKTGKLPGDAFQLATYARAMELLYGERMEYGRFWMGTTGRFTAEYDLRDWPVDRLTDEYGKTDAGIRAGVFEPKPEKSRCYFCDVRSHCDYAQIF